jgi:hypothetical protein
MNDLACSSLCNVIEKLMEKPKKFEGVHCLQSFKGVAGRFAAFLTHH